MTDQSHRADEAQCGSVHSAAELRNVPRAHLATGEAQAMPIYPSGMPAHGFCYDILIHIIAHYRPSNNRQK